MNNAEISAIKNVRIQIGLYPCSCIYAPESEVLTDAPIAQPIKEIAIKFFIQTPCIMYLKDIY